LDWPFCLRVFQSEGNRSSKGENLFGQAPDQALDAASASTLSSTSNALQASNKISVAQIEVKGLKTIDTYPKIKITSTRIRVIRLTASPGAKIQHTQLEGSKENYTFFKPGRYTVEPGVYEHRVGGKIVGEGFFEGVIEYN
jgi:hypothetical protein